MTPITVSNSNIISDTFNRREPTPFPEATAAITSKKTGDLTGFFQDRVSITPEALQQSSSAQQIKDLTAVTPANATKATDRAEPEQPPPSNESIQVSSSIGKAASSGNLNREEAIAIYQKIASLI